MFTDYDQNNLHNFCAKIYILNTVSFFLPNSLVKIALDRTNTLYSLIVAFVFTFFSKMENEGYGDVQNFSPLFDRQISPIRIVNCPDFLDLLDQYLPQYSFFLYCEQF